MADQAWIPVGKENDYNSVLIKKGDVVRLITGEKLTFIEMKRVKFHGNLNGQRTIVPVWRDRAKTKPFITEKLNERDESVITVSADVSGFTPGELFSLEGQKETFMYKNKETKGRKDVVKAIDVATGRGWNIDSSFTFVKIDLEEMKQKI